MSRAQLRRGDGPLGLGDDDAGCTILHIDMDAFYASVELISRPELVGKPVVVGASGGRGVVLSATYEARALGIHSAMPMSRAQRTAPTAVYLEPSHGLYSFVSQQVMEIFASITPLVEPLSLDEAFLDVAGAVRRLGSPARIGELIRARVASECHITCSVGVASTKFVAKLASTRIKPDGLLVVPKEKVLAFLHPLPVSSLWGVGERTEEQLTRLGLRTVGDIANTPVGTLQRALGSAVGVRLHELAWGNDPRAVHPDEPEKSVSNETTFAVDVDDPEVVKAELLKLSEKVAARLRAGQLVGRTLAIKVRFADFTTISRSKTIDSATDVAKEIYAVATDLYDALHLQRARIRLVGVRVEGLADANTATKQLLLDEPDVGWRDAEVAVDRLSERFGRGAVKPARLVKSPTEPTN